MDGGADSNRNSLQDAWTGKRANSKTYKNLQECSED